MTEKTKKNTTKTRATNKKSTMRKSASKRKKESKKRMRKKGKTRNSTGKPKKSRVPPRRRGEPFKTLMIHRRKRAGVLKDAKNARQLKKIGGNYANFLKLDLKGDRMDTLAYKVKMPPTYSSTLFAPPVADNQEKVHYLYRTYNFMDTITKHEMYMRTAQQAHATPKRYLARDEVKLPGISICLMAEFRRRREKLKLPMRRRCPEHNNFGIRMLESPRILVAKYQKFAQPFFGQMITNNKKTVKEAMTRAVQALRDVVQKRGKEAKGRIKKFLRRNKAWVKDRMACRRTPLFVKFPRDRLYANVVNRHPKMVYRRRGDQDLFNEFNYLPSHFSFSVHVCRVIRPFKLKRAKLENSQLKKSSSIGPSMIRVRVSRYSHFPALSVVNFNKNHEPQTALPPIPTRAPSIGADSAFSSDSNASAATDTPLDWQVDWKFTDKQKEHRMNNIGDYTHMTLQKAAENHLRMRKWAEGIRRKHALFKANERPELAVIGDLEKMHPPLLYCKLRSMELNTCRNNKRPDPAIAFLCKKRAEYLEKTLPCKNDPRVLLSKGWKTFSLREDPVKYNVLSRILKQKSAWVAKNCMSRSATVARCDKQPMSTERSHNQTFMVLMLFLTVILGFFTMAMIGLV
ncbi:unnamed protein product [Caenorhabditis sp. 36 PRJEB53466]|nr:unnamed protein product [Caenorhabditis sp. 36 PRJEB53466]